MYKFLTLLILIIFINSSCSKKDLNTPKLEKASIDEQMTKSYNEGLEALNSGDPFVAANKFSEAEILLPQSEWAAKSALMVGYCFYSINFYDDAILNLDILRCHSTT